MDDHNSSNRVPEMAVSQNNQSGNHGLDLDDALPRVGSRNKEFEPELMILGFGEAAE